MAPCNFQALGKRLGETWLPLAPTGLSIPPSYIGGAARHAVLLCGAGHRREALPPYPGQLPAAVWQVGASLSVPFHFPFSSLSFPRPLPPFLLPPPFLLSPFPPSPFPPFSLSPILFLPSPCSPRHRALCRALMPSVRQGGAGQRCPAGAPSALRLAQLHGGPARGGGAGQRLPSRLPALRLRLAGLTSERRAGGRRADAAIKAELRARSCVRRHGAGRGAWAPPGPRRRGAAGTAGGRLRAVGDARPPGHRRLR